MAIMRVRTTIAGLSGLPGVHTTYWTGASSVPVQADATDVCARVRAFWNGLITILAAGVIASVQQDVEVLDPATGTLTGALTSGTLTSVASTGTGELPAATMLLLKLGTAAIVNGRRLQGRSFIGPCAISTNANGIPTGGANSTLLTASNSFNTGATASTYQVWHRPDRITHAGGSVSPVTIYGTSLEFAVLRSRRD